MRAPSAIALAGTVLALAVPGTALAQGAGDQEYTDPFGAGNGDATPAPTATPAPPPPATAPSTAPTAPAPVATAAPPPAATAASAQPQLPYTGSPADAGLLAAAGGILLASGITLRVRLRDQP